MVTKRQEKIGANSNPEDLTSIDVINSSKVKLNRLEDEVNINKIAKVEYGRGLGGSGKSKSLNEALKKGNKKEETPKNPKNKDSKEALPNDFDKYMEKWMSSFDKAVKVQLGETPPVQEFWWGEDAWNKAGERWDKASDWVNENYDKAVNFVRDQSYRLLGISKDINKNNSFQNIMKGFIDTLLQSPSDLIGLLIKNPIKIVEKIQNVYNWLQTGIDTITKNYDLSKPKGQYNAGCWSYSVLMTVFG